MFCTNHKSRTIQARLGDFVSRLVQSYTSFTHLDSTSHKRRFAAPDLIIGSICNSLSGIVYRVFGHVMRPIPRIIFAAQRHKKVSMKRDSLRHVSCILGAKMQAFPPRFSIAMLNNATKSLCKVPLEASILLLLWRLLAMNPSDKQLVEFK